MLFFMQELIKRSKKEVEEKEIKENKKNLSSFHCNDMWYKSSPSWTCSRWYLQYYHSFLIHPFQKNWRLFDDK